MRAHRSGATRLAEALRSRGVPFVFGVAGSQNVHLLEGMRRAGLRVVPATSELSSAFMANGHARVSRRPAWLTTIPGPGFMWALPGIAEARLDAVPLVWICVAPAPSPDGRPTLQALPQVEVAGPLVKAVLPLAPGRDPAPLLAEAEAVAASGEPGPVLVHVDPRFAGTPAPGNNGAAWAGGAGRSPGEEGADGEPPLRAPAPDRRVLEEAASRLLRARRPLLLVGQGGLDAPGLVRDVARRLGAPVATTTSARGVLPEDDPLSLATDDPWGGPDEVNAALASADLVVALGCALTHNGSRGFQLELPPERLLWVNSRPEGPSPPYHAAHALRADVRSFLAAVLEGMPGTYGEHTGPGGERGWPRSEVARVKERLATARRRGAGSEPGVIAGGARCSAAELFGALRRALPRDAIVVTDSGRHQMLARRHFEVLAPGGLLVPADLQSMGFALPAAIGAKLAAPDRTVAVVLGDGGLQMSATELLTARREGVALTTLVLRDGELALIADDQRRRFGHSFATGLENPDLALLARSLGVRHLQLERDPERTLARAVGSPRSGADGARGAGATLVDVPLAHAADHRRTAARARVRNALRRVAGPLRGG